MWGGSPEPPVAQRRTAAKLKKHGLRPGVSGEPPHIKSGFAYQWIVHFRDQGWATPAVRPEKSVHQKRALEERHPLTTDFNFAIQIKIEEMRRKCQRTPANPKTAGFNSSFAIHAEGGTISLA
jgi:hypothetical protein